MKKQGIKLVKRIAMAWVVWVAAGARADIVSTSGSLFNPGDAAFAGATSILSLSSGSITLNTDTGAISGSLSGAALGDYFYLGQSQSGNVSLGVFVFDSINLPQGVSVNVTGSRGLVLASRHDFDLGTTLQLNGGDGGSLSVAGSGGGTGAGGAGAPGAEGGTASVLNSTTSLNRGTGGRGGFSSSTKAESGVGKGGGKVGTGTPTVGGSGGGYGGKGGKGTNNANSAGGVTYGDDNGDIGLTDLFGGSGGSGGYRQSVASNSAIGGGGGGGGAIELLALGTLNLSGTVQAKGGSGGSINRTTQNNVDSLAGGGGSGGGIVLAANQIALSGTVDASGGAGGTHTGSSSTRYYGGGGGGGRVAMYYGTLSGSTPTVGGNIFVNGGQATSGPSNAGVSGSSGSFHSGGSGSFPFQPVSTPELSSFCLAMIGAAPVLLRRRRSR